MKGFPGVTERHLSYGIRYEARKRLRGTGKVKSLGYFETPEAAANCYNAFVLEYKPPAKRKPGFPPDVPRSKSCGGKSVAEVKRRAAKKPAQVLTQPEAPLEEKEVLRRKAERLEVLRRIAARHRD